MKECFDSILNKIEKEIANQVDKTLADLIFDKVLLPWEISGHLKIQALEKLIPEFLEETRARARSEKELVGRIKVLMEQIKKAYQHDHEINR